MQKKKLILIFFFTEISFCKKNSNNFQFCFEKLYGFLNNVIYVLCVFFVMAIYAVLFFKALNTLVFQTMHVAKNVQVDKQVCYIINIMCMIKTKFGIHDKI